jgi:hypothetical protein
MTTALIAEDAPGVEVARLKAMHGAAAGLSLHLAESAGGVAGLDLRAHAS